MPLLYCSFLGHFLQLAWLANRPLYFVLCMCETQWPAIFVTACSWFPLLVENGCGKRDNHALYRLKPQHYQSQCRFHWASYYWPTVIHVGYPPIQQIEHYPILCRLQILLAMRPYVEVIMGEVTKLDLMHKIVFYVWSELDLTRFLKKFGLVQPNSNLI